jgi:hypothetical protein
MGVRAQADEHDMPLLRPDGADGSGGGGFLCEVPGVARFAASARAITVEADTADFLTFLMGPVLAGVLLLRGFLPLQAAAVELAGRRVLLAGPAGAGKSTLAAVLLRQGAHLLADRFAVLDADNRLQPMPPQILLWPDCRELAALPPGRPVRQVMPQGRTVHDLPFLPPAAGDADLMVHLTESPDGRWHPPQRISGALKLPLLQDRLMGAGLMTPERRLARLTHLAAAMPHYRLALPWSLARLPETAERLADWLRGMA